MGRGSSHCRSSNEERLDTEGQGNLVDWPEELASVMQKAREILRNTRETPSEGPHAVEEAA